LGRRHGWGTTFASAASTHYFGSRLNRPWTSQQVSKVCIHNCICFICI
jgi:hypothetical protein